MLSQSSVRQMGGPNLAPRPNRDILSALPVRQIHWFVRHVAYIPLTSVRHECSAVHTGRAPEQVRTHKMPLWCIKQCRY